MERNTSLNHRISADKKNDFNIAFSKAYTNLLEKGITITREDFLEALIVLASTSEKQLKTILEREILESR